MDHENVGTDIGAAFDIFRRLLELKIDPNRDVLGWVVKTNLKQPLLHQYMGDRKYGVHEAWFQFLSEIHKFIPSAIDRGLVVADKRINKDDIIAKYGANLLDKWSPKSEDNARKKQGKIDTAYVAYFWAHTQMNAEFKLAAEDIDKQLLGDTFENVFGTKVQTDPDFAYAMLSKYEQTGSDINLRNVSPENPNVLKQLYQKDNERLLDGYFYDFELKSELPEDGSKPKGCDVFSEFSIEPIEDGRFTVGFSSVDLNTSVTALTDPNAIQLNDAYSEPHDVGDAKFSKKGTSSSGFWKLQCADKWLSGVYRPTKHLFSILADDYKFTAELSVTLGDSSLCYFDGSKLNSKNKEFVIKKLLMSRKKETTEIGKLALQRSEYKVGK